MIRSAIISARHIRMRAGRAVLVTAAASIFFSCIAAVQGYAQDKDGLVAQSSPAKPTRKAPEEPLVAHTAAIMAPARRPPLPERRDVDTPASVKTQDL
jgi:hypothetical protein